MNFVFFQQPLENLVFGEASLDFLQAPALLELRVKLTGIYPTLFGLFGDAVIKVLFACCKAFALSNRLDHQIAPDLTLGHCAEFGCEFVALFRGNLVRFRIVVGKLPNPARRNVEGVGANDLVYQLLAHFGFDVTLRVFLEVGANGCFQGCERIEIADFASKRVVENRSFLTLHVLESDFHRLGLSALGFVGVGLTPHDRFFLQHQAVTQWTFRLLLVAMILEMVALRLERRMPVSLLRVNTAFVIVLAGYLMVMFFGPSPANLIGTEVHAVSQKLIVYTSIGVIFAQALLVRTHMARLLPAVIAE